MLSPVFSSRSFLGSPGLASNLFNVYQDSDRDIQKSNRSIYIYRVEGLEAVCLGSWLGRLSERHRSLVAY